MKNLNKEMKTNSKVNKVHKLGAFLNKNMPLIACMLLIGIMVIGITQAYAPNAETLWSDVKGLIEKWVTRLGGVVMFVGGVMFGLGWKSDDAEQKSRGISTIIAGAIVVAVAELATRFFI
jgi:hypothetical protein